MSAVTHTQGPWRALIYKPEMNREHIIVAGNCGHIPVARTGRWDTASAADARLIAAAPDLLATLRTCPDLPDDWHPHNPDAVAAFATAFRKWQGLCETVIQAATEKR